MTYAFRDGSLGAYYPAQPAEDNGVGALGHPLYVNGHLYQEPVTISHVPGPVAGLGADDEFNARLKSLYPAVALVGAVTGAYHGYKRNNSVGWSVAWGILGGMFPFITLPISLAQGFGEKK